MKKYVDGALLAFDDSIKVLVLTGGEAFLLGKDLDEIVKYAAEKDLVVRIVSNGFWAKNYDVAYQRLKELVDLGLKEINFSTGDDHLKWVPYDNIINGCMAAIELGITCAVNVERHDKSDFQADTFYKDKRLRPYIEKSKKNNTTFMVESSVWIKFCENSEISYDSMPIDEQNNGCKNLFNTISINPYSQMLACCGLTSEHILPLRLGEVKDNNILELYNSQFNDFMKIWLYVDGPTNILKFIYKKRNIEYGTIVGHTCEICAEIFRDTENVLILKNNYKEVVFNVLFKYSLNLKTITNKFWNY
jgi:hypothetical protein